MIDDDAFDFPTINNQVGIFSCLQAWTSNSRHLQIRKYTKRYIRMN